MRARLLVLALGLLLVPGCGGASKSSPVGSSLTVLAASSLTDVLPRIDASARYVFAGSDDLAAQIREGAPADVFLSAGPPPIEQLRRAGRVGPLRVFARNRLVLVVPRSNPAQIRRISDIRRLGGDLLLAGRTVPAGMYARKALARLGMLVFTSRATSEEPDVRSILTKVALGEADAGIVYATDVAAAGKKVRALPIPRSAQPRIVYLGAVVTAGDRLAGQRFLDRLTGPVGRRALRQAGFLLP